MKAIEVYSDVPHAMSIAKRSTEVSETAIHEERQPHHYVVTTHNTNGKPISCVCGDLRKLRQSNSGQPNSVEITHLAKKQTSKPKGTQQHIANQQQQPLSMLQLGKTLDAILTASDIPPEEHESPDECKQACDTVNTQRDTQKQEDQAAPSNSENKLSENKPTDAVKTLSELFDKRIAAEVRAMVFLDNLQSAAIEQLALDLFPPPPQKGATSSSCSAETGGSAEKQKQQTGELEKNLEEKLKLKEKRNSEENIQLLQSGEKVLKMFLSDEVLNENLGSEQPRSQERNETTTTPSKEQFPAEGRKEAKKSLSEGRKEAKQSHTEGRMKAAKPPPAEGREREAKPSLSEVGRMSKTAVLLHLLDHWTLSVLFYVRELKLSKNNSMFGQTIEPRVRNLVCLALEKAKFGERFPDVRARMFLSLISELMSLSQAITFNHAAMPRAEPKDGQSIDLALLDECARLLWNAANELEKMRILPAVVVPDGEIKRLQENFKESQRTCKRVPESKKTDFAKKNELLRRYLHFIAKDKSPDIHGPSANTLSDLKTDKTRFLSNLKSINDKLLDLFAPSFTNPITNQKDDICRNTPITKEEEKECRCLLQLPPISTLDEKTAGAAVSGAEETDSVTDEEVSSGGSYCSVM